MKEAIAMLVIVFIMLVFGGLVLYPFSGMSNEEFSITYAIVILPFVVYFVGLADSMR